MDIENPLPRERFYVAAAVAVAAFVVYAKTLCGDVFWQDSGLFNRSIALLGSGVPPGFPGWHLACYLFAMLPGIDPILGMNLFSAVAGAATAYFIVLLVYEIAGGGWATSAGAAVAALAYSLAPTVWIQSTTCEVYTMNMALTAATMLALFVWRRRADARWLYAAAFAFGIACTNHPQQAVLLIPYAAFVVWQRRAAGLRPRQLYMVAALWLLAMSVYLYLPIRSAAGVAENWGKPRTLYGLYFHLTCKEFQGQMFSSPWAVVGWRTKTAAWLFLDQFRWVGLATALVGAVWLAWRRRGYFLYFVAISFFTLILTVNYPSFGFRAWYFPFYMLTAICAGFAVTRVGELLGRWRRVAAYVFLALAAAVALLPAVARFYQADRTSYPYVRDFGANYMRSIGYANFCFLGEENSAPTTGIQALTTVEFARPDVFFVDITGNANYFDVFDFGNRDLSHADPDVVAQYYYEIMGDVLADGRRDYCFLYPYDFVRMWGYRLVKEGAVYRLIRPGEAPRSDDILARYVLRGIDPPVAYMDHWARGTVGNFVYDMFLQYRRRDERRAEECFALADRLGRRSHEVQHNLGTVFYLDKDYAGAVPYFERSVALDPTDSFTRYLLADSYDQLGRSDDARREVEMSLRYKPGYKPAIITLETGRFVKW